MGDVIDLSSVKNRHNSTRVKDKNLRSISIAKDGVVIETIETCDSKLIMEDIGVFNESLFNIEYCSRVVKNKSNVIGCDEFWKLIDSLITYMHLNSDYPILDELCGKYIPKEIVALTSLVFATYKEDSKLQESAILIENVVKGYTVMLA